MDEDPLHAERVGDETRVLPAGTAEAAEGVLSDVVAALHGYALDGIRHVVDGNLEKTLGNLLR